MNQTQRIKSRLLKGFLDGRIWPRSDYLNSLYPLEPFSKYGHLECRQCNRRDQDCPHCHGTGFSKKLYHVKAILQVRYGHYISGICPTCEGAAEVYDPHRIHPLNVLFAERFICPECDGGRIWYVYHHKRKVWDRVY